MINKTLESSELISIGVEEFTFDITPCPKPRMTQSDKWKVGDKKRPSVAKYHDFRDQIKAKIKYYGNDLQFEEFEIGFYIPMPKSWSERKKQSMLGKPHQQRPDLDNYLKAWKDSVFEEDSVVWKVYAYKRWAIGAGHIRVKSL